MTSTNRVSVVISPPNFDLDSYKLLHFNESFEQLFDRACDNILSDEANLEASNSEHAVAESLLITSSDGAADEPDTAASASKKSRYVYVPSPRKIKHTYGKKGVANRTITMIDLSSDDEDEATQKPQRSSESNVDNFAGAEAPLLDMDDPALLSEHASETSNGDIDMMDADEDGGIASLEPSNQDEFKQVEDESRESCVGNSVEPEESQIETTGFLGRSADDALNGDVSDEEAIEKDTILAGPTCPPSFASIAAEVPQARPSATALSRQKKTDGLFSKKTPEKKSVLAHPSEFFNQDNLIQSEGEEPDERASDASSSVIDVADAEEAASSERKSVDFETLTMEDAGFPNRHTDEALKGDIKDETMEEDAIFASLEPSKRDKLMQSIVSHPFMTKGGYPVVRSERCEFVDHISKEAMDAGTDKMAIYRLIRYVRKLYLTMNSSMSEADIDALEGVEFGDERRKKQRRNPDRPVKKSKRKKRLLDNDDLPENTGPDGSNETRNSPTVMSDAFLEESTLAPDSQPEVERAEPNIDALEDHRFGDERQQKRKSDLNREEKPKRKKRVHDSDDPAELIVSQMPMEGNSVDAEDHHLDYDMKARHDNLPEVEAPDHHSSNKAKRNKRKRERQKKKKADKHRESLLKVAPREGTPPAKEVKVSTPKESKGTPSKSPGSSRKSSHDELPADPGLWDVDF